MILAKNNVSHSYSDLFGKQGMAFLYSLTLADNYKPGHFAIRLIIVLIIGAVHWILVEAAIHAVKRPGVLRRFYFRIERKKGGQIAKVATARKLLEWIYHILRDGRTYQENYRPSYSQSNPHILAHSFNPTNRTVESCSLQ